MSSSPITRPTAGRPKPHRRPLLRPAFHPFPSHQSNLLVSDHPRTSSILFEMTDDSQIILPLMLAVVVSHLMASWLNPESIYTTKLRHLGGGSLFRRERAAREATSPAVAGGS